MTLNMPEQRCIRCDAHPPFKHPSTGKVYKLCAVCGLKALAHAIGLEVDEHYNLINPETSEQYIIGTVDV